ncbi:MAG: thioesterase [bacterium]|nr:thioesterase [bacterium]
MKKIKLFCLPYAGGSAATYNKWRPFLDKHIELYPVELSGRGKRIYDPLYQSLEEAIEDVYNMIHVDLQTGPYAFYGHSMGGILAYELAYKIRDNNLPEPLHIFFSGRGATDIPHEEDEEMYHLLPEDEFREKIIELGGTPKEFFEHPELLEVLLPMLRSDFKIAETYEHDSEVIPFDHDISILLGKEEDVSDKRACGWKSHTKHLCNIHYLEGDHFFIHDHTERIVSLVNQTLLYAYRHRKK